MVLGLRRLFGRDHGRPEPEEEPAVVAVVAPSMPGFPATAVPDLPVERRFSVWDRLRDDPAAQAVRAQWEAKWAAF